MDIVVELENGTENTLLEVGRFVDLVYLVEKLNEGWDDLNYSLNPAPKEKGVFVFVKDPLNAKEYWSGKIHKIKDKAYAEPVVHTFIMDEYDRYVNEVGSME